MKRQIKDDFALIRWHYAVFREPQYKLPVIAVYMKINIAWNVTPRSPAEMGRRIDNKTIK